MTFPDESSLEQHIIVEHYGPPLAAPARTSRGLMLLVAIIVAIVLFVLTFVLEFLLK